VKLKNSVINFLLTSDFCTEYRTRLDLLEEKENVSEVKAARQKMISHPQVAAIIEELGARPGEVLSSHKSSGHLTHKLSFLADIWIKQK